MYFCFLALIWWKGFPKDVSVLKAGNDGLRIMDEVLK